MEDYKYPFSQLLQIKDDNSIEITNLRSEYTVNLERVKVIIDRASPASRRRILREFVLRPDIYEDRQTRRVYGYLTLDKFFDVCVDYGLSPQSPENPAHLLFLNRSIEKVRIDASYFYLKRSLDALCNFAFEPNSVEDSTYDEERQMLILHPLNLKFGNIISQINNSKKGYIVAIVFPQFVIRVYTSPRSYMDQFGNRSFCLFDVVTDTERIDYLLNDLHILLYK